MTARIQTVESAPRTTTGTNGAVVSVPVPSVNNEIILSLRGSGTVSITPQGSYDGGTSWVSLSSAITTLNGTPSKLPWAPKLRLNYATMTSASVMADVIVI